MQILSIASPSIESIVNEAIQDALDVANPMARDIRIVRDPSTCDADRLMALERIAKDVPWPPSKHAARGGARKIRAAFTAYVTKVRAACLISGDVAYAEQAFADARRDLLGQAILEVLATLHKEQGFRLGSGKGSFWVHDVPARLPFHQGWFHRWFHARVIATAEEHLFSELDLVSADGPHMVSLETRPEPADQVHGDLLRSLPIGWDDLRTNCSDPLTILIAQEEQDEAAMILRAVLDVASPQRELLRLMYAGLSQATAASELDIQPETARGHMYRLRKKLM